MVWRMVCINLLSIQFQLYFIFDNCVYGGRTSCMPCILILLQLYVQHESKWLNCMVGVHVTACAYGPTYTELLYVGSNLAFIRKR